MYKDPRGERRTIAKENKHYKQTARGLSIDVTVTLSCGHVREVNPIYSYKPGEVFHCLACQDAEDSS